PAHRRPQQSGEEEGKGNGGEHIAGKKQRSADGDNGGDPDARGFRVVAVLGQRCAWYGRASILRAANKRAASARRDRRRGGCLHAACRLWPALRRTTGTCPRRDRNRGRR